MRNKRAYTLIYPMTQRLDIDNLAQIQLCAGHNLRMITRAVTQHFDNKLRPLGLRVSQFSILGVLAVIESITPEAITMTALADRLMLDRTTLARNLEPLERDALVQIVPGEDRRTRLVRLTEQGHAKLAEGFPRWQEAQAQIVDAFGEQRWQELRNELHELATLAM